ncbi:MAG: hypothetical protein R6U43_07060, partial [Candidatus Krumholzibacteriales bacterium]
AAYIMRGNSWAGWEIGEKQAKFWGSLHDISKTRGLTKKISNWLIKKVLILSSYNMSEEKMFSYQRKLNSYRPQLITGYASALYLFARFIRENNLNIYSPKGIISSAETLYEHQREYIESVFGCDVLNRYGCRETGDIAQECKEKKGLHIYSEHLIVEVVDEDGNPCPPGRMGELVVTDLSNYVFPFIRYKIGDLGALSDRVCPCGRNLPMLEKVEGRIWDVVVGTNGNRMVGALWHVVKNADGIKQYQVVQEKLGELTLKLVVDKNFNSGEKEKLIDMIREKLGREMKVDIELVDTIPLTESGKLRYVISEVSPYKE